MGDPHSAEVVGEMGEPLGLVLSCTRWLAGWGFPATTFTGLNDVVVSEGAATTHQRSRVFPCDSTVGWGEEGSPVTHSMWEREVSWGTLPHSVTTFIR